MKPHTHDVTATAPKSPQATRPSTPILELIGRIIFAVAGIVWLYFLAFLDGITHIISLSASALAQEFGESDCEYLREGPSLDQRPAWIKWLVRAWNGEAGFPGFMFMLLALFGALAICWWSMPAHADPSVDGIKAVTYECEHGIDTSSTGFTCGINQTIEGGPYMILTRTARLIGKAGKRQAAAVAKIKADYAAQGGPWIIFRDATGQYPAKLCALQSAGGISYYQCGYGDPSKTTSKRGVNHGN